MVEGSFLKLVILVVCAWTTVFWSICVVVLTVCGTLVFSTSYAVNDCSQGPPVNTQSDYVELKCTQVETVVILSPTLQNLLLLYTILWQCVASQSHWKLLGCSLVYKFFSDKLHFGKCIQLKGDKTLCSNFFQERLINKRVFY